MAFEGKNQASPETRVEFDPELRASLAVVGGVFPPTITKKLIDFMRTSYASSGRDLLLESRAVTVEDIEILESPDARIEASIVRPNVIKTSAVILCFHSGGLMFGDRFSGLDRVLDWVEDLGLVLVTIEYRLAPEYPYPTPFNDCYDSLLWLAENASSLGVDPDRILLAGASAGGGLAAAVALAARDRNGPQPLGLLLDYPMLDDRAVSASIHEFDGVGVWDRVSNETGWAAYLGESVATPNVSPYAAPARAETLAGLPPVFLSVGSAEIFRDEVIDFAERIWKSGGNAQLHVWPGAFHACDIFAPYTRISRQMIGARYAWLEHILDE